MTLSAELLVLPGIVAVLNEINLLTQADLAILVVYCTAWSQLQEASKTIEKEGATFAHKDGYVGVHPAVAMQKAAWGELRASAQRLGLDPSSRSRIQLPAKEDEADPFTEFLNRGKAC